MLSVIVYGRNDTYGYNMHKRVALSLNCMAEVLEPGSDELLFVDYNTPDDHPTCPEAIADTLTARARRLLRILRVRPAQHQRFRALTHLVALEPIARNVALRRSNPENRWILSTNTDMIFVPHGAGSLSSRLGGLEPALYHLPRFEIPETLWEGLDRMDPAGTIAEIRGWGRDLHLNEIVLGSDAILYDGPGDFQLATREDLFAIDGFDERMLLGWHVDSNLAARFGLLRGAPASMLDRLFGYHCDHTRQVTPAHRHDRVQNDQAVFVDGITEATIPGQADRWGLAGETVEEVRLDGAGGVYVGALRAAIGAGMEQPSQIGYRTETYDQVGYDPRHVLPYLVDAVSCFARDTTLGWIGVNPALLAGFLLAWRGLGFTGPVLVPDEADWLAASGGQSGGIGRIAADAGIFVVDFGEGGKNTATADRVAGWFTALTAAERSRLAPGGVVPRRFIAVNAVHGRFELLVAEHIGAAAAPIATRMRQGFVLPLKKIPWRRRLKTLALRLRLWVGVQARTRPVLQPLYRLWRQVRYHDVWEAK